MKKKKKRKPVTNETCSFDDNESDEYFYFIAGYTSGGIPFGITWEEAKEEGLIEDNVPEIEDERLPF
ncbi:MAG: hypothetical protein ACRC5C_05970 [Bacilli bacterium]